ncbi:MAG TPA: hypothetical protein VEC11_01960 [Allosphingosinicella sp.]|nr:hypothetical protein [Allosphingosinicella sp.]
MLGLLILFAGLGLLVVVLGLPLLLGSDSPVPDYIGFVILASMIALVVWGMGAWWLLAPIAFLVALTLWLDRAGGEAPVDPAALDERGWSARTRLRFRLWAAALLAPPLLIASLFILPEGSFSIVVPGLVIAMTAMSLFRFSFTRSIRRDDSA